MLQWFARRMKEAKEDEKGFTLIELLVVVIIIGVLAAIAIPAYLAQTDRARDAVVEADARQAGTAINTCLLETTGGNCITEAQLDAFGYNRSSDVAFSATNAGNVVTSVHTIGTPPTNTGTYRSDTGVVTVT